VGGTRPVYRASSRGPRRTGGVNSPSPPLGPSGQARAAASGP
jgi:hypothetical protein